MTAVISVTGAIDSALPLPTRGEAKFPPILSLPILSRRPLFWNKRKQKKAFDEIISKHDETCTKIQITSVRINSLANDLSSAQEAKSDVEFKLIDARYELKLTRIEKKFARNNLNRGLDYFSHCEEAFLEQEKDTKELISRGSQEIRDAVHNPGPGLSETINHWDQMVCMSQHSLSAVEQTAADAEKDVLASAKKLHSSIKREKEQMKKLLSFKNEEQQYIQICNEIKRQYDEAISSQALL